MTDESNVEWVLQDLEQRTQHVEEKGEAAASRLSNLENVLSRLAGDKQLTDSLADNLHDAERSNEEVRLEREKLASEVDLLGRQIELQLVELSNERQAVSELAMLGIDVSETTAILDERQQWLEACHDKVVELGERIGLLVEAFEMGDQQLGSVGKASGVIGEKAEVGDAESDRMPDEFPGDALAGLVADFDLKALDAAAAAAPPSPPNDSDGPIVNWDSPTVSPMLQGAMDYLHAWLVRDLNPQLNDVKVLRLGPSTPTVVWPNEQEFASQYQIFRNSLLNAGVPESQLASFDIEFNRAVLTYQRERYMRASSLDDYGIISPGMGPSVLPTIDMYEKARSRANSQEITRDVIPLLRTREPLRALEGGGTTYDSPESQADRLNWYQGLSTARVQGDCGLCAVQNVGILAGKELSETDIIGLATDHGLCAMSPSLSPGDRGGTSVDSRKNLLKLIGIDSHIDFDHDIDHVASLVESGRGVIASVDASRFWRGAIPFDVAGGHAVTITSVDRDASGKPTYFHVCDSGLHDANYLVTAEQLAFSFRKNRGLNVTDAPIR